MLSYAWLLGLGLAGCLAERLRPLLLLSFSTTAAAAMCVRWQMQASQFSDLPPALLTRILQAVPQGKRMRNCATVCSSWAAAAAAATVTLDLNLTGTSGDVVAASQSWLQQHGSQLVSLKLKLQNCMAATSFCNSVQPPNSTLPSSDRAGVNLQLSSATDASSSSTATDTAALSPKLKALKLKDVNPGTLPQLVQLSGLTRFKLVVWGPPARPAELKALTAAVQPLVQGLPKLADLSLQCPTDPAGVIPVLPADSLTALSFASGANRANTLGELPASITRLVNLRKLELADVKVNPAVLSGMTVLTHLQLQGYKANAGSASAFLAAVRGMRQLRHLSLASVLEADPFKLRAAQRRDCAALTAAG
jgi:hypothetical protein